MSTPGGEPNFNVYAFGKDERWQKLSDALYALIEDVVKAVRSEDSEHRESSARSGALAAALDIAKDYAKAHVEKPSVEVEKLKAEITKLYAESEETFAKAEVVRLQNAMKRLELAMQALQYAENIRLTREQRDATVHLGIEDKPRNIKS